MLAVMSVEALFVVGPQPYDFHGFDLRQNLIDQAVLNVDAPGARPSQISDQLFVWGRILKGVLPKDFKHGFRLRP